MNVNSASYHLFLGADDWGRCVPDGASLPLSRLWTREGLPYEAGLPEYAGGALALAALPEPIAPTPGERLYAPADHRDAAADRNGNRYRVSDDRKALVVASAGDGRETTFWPPAQSGRWAPPPVFADPDPAIPALTFRAVVVTTDSYLVAAGADGDADILWRFDLVGGGDPDRLPLGPGIRADALAADLAGGVWLLDGLGRRLLRFDRDLELAMQEAPGAPAAFAPDGETPLPETVRTPVAIDCSAVPAPVALATLADGALVLLDAPTGSPAGLFIVDPGAAGLRSLIRVDFEAFCMALGAQDGEPALMLGVPSGNEARRIALFPRNGLWQAGAEADTLPLRRFGGRALVGVGGTILYDSGDPPRWVPVVELRHNRFLKSATIVTPPLDGREPQCVWDRLRIDGCIPPGAAVLIEARAAEEATLLDPQRAGGWIAQPAPVLSPTGIELPGKRAIAALTTDAAKGRGTWELLLQGISGRYAQLRITLTGTERNTPRLRALRAWYPRFSYPQRFLPGVYREDSTAGAFLERFLANFEGINTFIEDRIATVERLFDPRIVPADALDWLAGWFDTALDPSWDERRRRLFIANAPRFFAWRGTRKGLLLALKLALDPDIEAADFDLDGPDCDCPGQIRIVEGHSTRPRPAALPAPPPPGMGGGPVATGFDTLWLPEEGASGLWARWLATYPAKPDGAGLAFPLVAPADMPVEWASFVQKIFGFVPVAGAAERADWFDFQRAQAIADTDLAPLPAGNPTDERIAAMWSAYCAIGSPVRAQWQAYLQRRYRTTERLQRAHGTGWSRFDLIPLPSLLPGAAPAIRDWWTFEGSWLPMTRAAHRFSVLLPRKRVDTDPDAEARQLALAQRIIALEKPAHTLFDARFYWAMNRIGEARLGYDTGIGAGSRAPELIPGAVLGRSYVGAAFVGGAGDPGGGRSVLRC